MGLLVYCIYFFSGLLMLQVSVWWSFWIFLEAMSWSLSLMLKNFSMMKFLMWQSLSSVFLFFFMSLDSSVDFMLLLLLFKVAIPPFHSWVVEIVPMFPWKPFIVFMLFSKIPLTGLFLHIQQYLMILIIVSIITQGFIKMWEFSQMKFYIWTCLISDFIWMVLSLKSSVLFLAYIYTLLMTGLLLCCTSNFFYMKIFLAMSSVPFFSGFMVKLLILSVYLNTKMMLLLCFNIFYIGMIWNLMLLISSWQCYLILKPSSMMFFIFYFTSYFWWFFY